MGRLIRATEPQVESIYRESFALWGGGLSLSNYIGLWRDLRDAPWARAHVRFVVWSGDGGEVLSSAKLYRPTVLIHGRAERATVLGALFTPAKLRKRGHASDLVRAVLDEARGRGERAVLLYSDVGTDYYRDLGFRKLPAGEFRGRIGRGGRDVPAGWSIDPLREDDLESLVRFREADCRRRGLAILRDRAHWEYLRLRSERFFERAGVRDVRHGIRVGWFRGRRAGYVIAVEGRGEWNVREVGARDGDPRGMGDVLQAAGAEAMSRGIRTIHGWIPQEVVAHAPSWSGRHRARTQAVPMIAPLDPDIDTIALRQPGAVTLSFLDQF